MAALANVLSYHVTPGRVLARVARRLSQAPTVQGQSLTIRYAGRLIVDDANVIEQDKLATSGIIHANGPVTTRR